MARTDRSLGLPACFVFVSLVIAICASPATASQGFTFQKIALMGEAAPGTEQGTVFAPLSDIYVTNVPSLDQDGRVSFVATLEGPAVTSSNRTGIWSWHPGALTLVTRAGLAAPEVTSGAFTSFPVDFALGPPSAGGERVAFSATVDGPGISVANDEGAWVVDAGELHLFTREGSPAPGLLSGVRLSSPSQLEVNHAGHAFLSSPVAGTGVTSENDEVFWTDRGGQLAAILREGDPAPGTGSGIVFGGAGQFIGTGYSFGAKNWSHGSGLALEASVTGPGVTTFDNEAVFAERGGAWTLIAREGERAPGMSGNDTFGGNSVRADFNGLAFNALEQITFTARVGPSATYVLFSDHTGALLPVARPGDPAPGTAQTFGLLTSGRLSDGGRIAFRATLSGGGQWPPLGLWWDQVGTAGQIAPVAIPGDPVPGRPGVTYVSVNFILDFNAAGQLAFAATLDDPTVGQRQAILIAQPSGLVSEVVATGDHFDVQGSAGPGTDLRQISAVRFGAMNGAGEMAIRLDFADGRFGIYQVSPSTTTAVDPSLLPGVQLAQNVPNPFAAATRFDFTLAVPSRVRVAVYDAAGRLVRRLLDEPRAAGAHSVSWNGRDHAGARLASGAYWARLEAGAAKRSVAVVILRP